MLLLAGISGASKAVLDCSLLNAQTPEITTLHLKDTYNPYVYLFSHGIADTHKQAYSYAGIMGPFYITFDFPDAAGIESALSRAIECWFHDPDKWRKLMISGMNIDFSWDVPADKYLQIYKSLIK